jgi:hypothetical protein
VAQRTDAGIGKTAVVICDSRELAWEPSDYLPRALRKVLSRDADGDPIVLLRWVTRDLPELDRPAGGYHLGHEFYYCIAGECPHWEFESGELEVIRPERATLVTLREGYWLEHLPRTPHGGGTPVAAVDLSLLGWMTASDDPLVGLRESAGLTETLAGLPADPPPTQPGRADSGAAMVLGGHRGATLLDTRLLAWEPHPLLPRAHHKPLSRRADGDATVSIEWIPSGAYPAAELPYRARQRFRELTYVLAGELTVVEHDDDGPGTPRRWLPGFWIDRPPGSVYGFAAGESSPTGCMLLRFRAREDAVFVKEQVKHTDFSPQMRHASE